MDKKTEEEIRNLINDPQVGGLFSDMIDNFVWSAPIEHRLTAYDGVIAMKLGEEKPEDLLCSILPELNISQMFGHLDEDHRQKACRALAGETGFGISGKLTVLATIKYIMEPLCRKIEALEQQNRTYMAALESNTEKPTTSGQTGTGGSN